MSDFFRGIDRVPFKGPDSDDPLRNTRTTKASLLEYGAIAGSIFLGGIPGMIYQNTAGIGLLGIFMKFSRSAEEEADKLGVQYMYAAGYDPSAMATMFEKLEAKNKKKPGFIARAFQTQPAPPDRR